MAQTFDRKILRALQDNFPTGVIGHAAILNADGYVLEMPGGPNWFWGISDNNRKVLNKE
ncbi:hypothetical protein [Lactococcus lactis]|uniref:hypothetical protein n=1 Tax=Lactococcus lactis TaxID=1358 RepID=UPI00241006D5|nr:hypothetical protein [Lactococcus lactis]